MRINKLKHKGHGENVFFNIEKPDDNTIKHLEDGDYEGKIIKVVYSKSKKLSAIYIEVQGIEQVFVTFVHLDLSKSFSWRNPIWENNISVPSELEGMEIIFHATNNEVEGRIYTNLSSIALFSSSESDDGGDDALTEEEI